MQWANNFGGRERPSPQSFHFLMRAFLKPTLPFLLILAAATAKAQTPTTTDLSVSSSSVTAGTVVTLTATVTLQSNSSPVYPGRVTFCDSTVTYCLQHVITPGLQVVGNVQLTSSGTAVLKVIPGVGTHNYVAVFNGAPNGTVSTAPSSSSQETMTVTGGPTNTTLSYTGTGPYTLTGTVVGNGSFLSPTGIVSFVDTTNAGYVLGSATLSAGTSSQSFASAAPYGNQGTAHFVAIGDFNGDGIPDLAITNTSVSLSGGGTGPGVSIFLGNGDGTFPSTRCRMRSGTIHME